MGHYLSEMMCDRCGCARCVCPPKPDKTLDHWVLDNGIPIKARDYEKKRGWMSRMYQKHYPTKEEAIIGAEAWRLKEIEGTKAHIRLLFNRLHELQRRGPTQP